MQRTKVYVVGVGLTKFQKPRSGNDKDYPELVKEAVTACLKDSKLQYESVERAYVGYVYGDSTCGQRSLYELGYTGIPIFNVHNNCSTGSSALMLAYEAIKGGHADCVLAVGFDKMDKGPLDTKYQDRENPLEKHIEILATERGIEAVPMLPQMFGAAAREHMEKYGTKPCHFAKIALKNHNNSVNNPYAQNCAKYSLEEIVEAPMIYDPLTKLQCCPTSDGAAAAILVSDDFMHKNCTYNQSVEILGIEMATDLSSSFHEKSCIKMIGFDMTKLAKDKLFKNTGLKIEDVDVIELHDCFSANELITYEALGLCEVGEAAKFIDNGQNTYGGKFVVNPSGGLISKGHPLGATGIAQCAELCWQLRGIAGNRQVPNAKVGLQHNIGLGGAAIVGLYARPQKVMKEENKTHKKSIKKFKVEPLFKLIEERMKKDGEQYVKKIKGIFCFKVTNGPDNQTAYWLVDAKNHPGSVKQGKGNNDVLITIRDSDLFDLMLGRLNPQKAFLQRKLKIKGNMALALKLRQLNPADLNAKL